MNKLLLPLIHFLFRSSEIRKEIKKFAEEVHHKKILEIGCGNNPSRKYFSQDNEFTESDINPSDKTILKLDMTKIDFKSVTLKSF